ncbi:B-cell receptor CD22-like [Numenius arquata]|uniref:B-cell receptor CD22-like n=1 Tax=Numenius arquata TaxID=31919 RepID=UPI003D308E0C
MRFFVFLLFFIPGSPSSCPDPVTGPQEMVVGVGSCLYISCRYDLCQAGPGAQLHQLSWIHRPNFDQKTREFRGRVVARPSRTPGADQGDCDLILPHMGKEDGGQYGLRLVAQPSRRNFKELLWMHFVTVNVTDTPPAPHLWPDPAPINQGLRTSFGCWVPPACPGDTPTFAWEGPASKTAGFNVEPWAPPATVTSHPAIGSLLTFNPFWYHDGTLLNCTLRGPDGRTISRASRLLQVNYPPRNVQVDMSPSHPVHEGEEVTLTCRDSAKPPSYAFSWSLGGRTLSQSGAQLLLRPVQAADGGSYRCQATNDVGTTQSPAVPLEVYYAPRDVRVEVTPASPVLEGGEVTLSCGHSSHPPPHTFAWSLGGRSLPHSGARLLLGPARATHGGSYRCEVTNSLGTATSPPHHPGVPPQVAILENLTSLPALIGSRVTLRCTLGPAHPEPLIQWQRDDREVGPPGPTLSFDADPAHTGLYRCIGQNPAGSALSPPLPVVVWFSRPRPHLF